MDEGSNILLRKLKGKVASEKDTTSKELKEKSFSFKFTKENVRLEFARTSVLLFEVTEKCNLNCTYCTYSEYYVHHSKRNREDLTFDKAKNLIDFYLENRNSIFGNFDFPLTIGFYGGEPLLNMVLIKKIISYSERTIPLVKFSATTNALLLDQYMDYLSEKEFSLLISLDGNESNNEYRLFPNGKPSYNRIFKNIKSLASRYPEYFKNNVRFNCVLHNKNNVNETNVFFTKEFGKQPMYSDLTTTNLNISKITEFNHMLKDPNSIPNTFLKKNKCAEENNEYIEDTSINNPVYHALYRFILAYSGTTFDDYYDLLTNETLNIIPTGTCLPFNKKIFLTTKGNILPCERIGDLFDFGTVTDKSVCIDFAKIAEKYNSFYRNMKEVCSVCDRFYYCRECIFQVENLDSIPKCKFSLASSDYLDKLINYYMNLLEEKPQLFKYYLDNVFFG